MMGLKIGEIAVIEDPGAKRFTIEDQMEALARPAGVRREEARVAGRRYFFTGRPCKRGHVAERHTSSGVCVECQPILNAEWRRRNPDFSREYRRKRGDDYRNMERAANRERARKNPDKEAARAAKYRAAKISATPPWLTAEQLSQIEAFYAEARACDEFEVEFFGDSGGFHVDHVVPLQGKSVCGLHVPWNLQILSASENCSKRNLWVTR